MYGFYDECESRAKYRYYKWFEQKSKKQKDHWGKKKDKSEKERKKINLSECDVLILVSFFLYFSIIFIYLRVGVTGQM